MRYRKKPVEVEAVQWTGRNFVEVRNFVKAHTDRTIASFVKRRSNTMTEALFANLIPDAPKHVTAALWVDANGQYLGIENGEWVIADDLGCYPCKDDQFRRTYEPVTVFEDLRQGISDIAGHSGGYTRPEPDEEEQPSSTPLVDALTQMIRERGPAPFPAPKSH